MPAPAANSMRTNPNYRWAVVGMLWFICFFNYADRVAISSVFPVLEKTYHFSKTDLGLIGAAFTWVYAAASPFAGTVGDRYPRKWVILGGLYVWSLITGLTAQCRVVWQFVVVRGAEGLGEAFYFPASMALISDYHTPATRSRAIGFHQTSIFAGTIGGAALAGWMAQKFGWQSPFWVLAIAGCVLGLILKAFIKEPRRNQAEREEIEEIENALAMPESPAIWAGTAVKDVDVDKDRDYSLQLLQAETEPLSMLQFMARLAQTPTALLLVAAYFGANMVGQIFLVWMPTFLKEKFHLSLAAAGVGATLFIQLASIAGSLLGGVFADYRAKSRLDGRIQVQAMATLLGAPFIFVCGYTRTPWMLITAMTLFGLFKGMYDSNLTSAYYDVIPPQRRGSATGLMNMIGWIGAGIGSVAIGVAVDHKVTMSVAISSAASVYLIVSAILWCTAVFTARKDIQAVRRA